LFVHIHLPVIVVIMLEEVEVRVTEEGEVKGGVILTEFVEGGVSFRVGRNDHVKSFLVRRDNHLEGIIVRDGKIVVRDGKIVVGRFGLGKRGRDWELFDGVCTGFCLREVPFESEGGGEECTEDRDRA
jgi:hypothetical protein